MPLNTKFIGGSRTQPDLGQEWIAGRLQWERCESRGHAQFFERLGGRFPRPTCDRLHWCLDVKFGDDYARARTGHVAHNLALVRHIALNLIRLNSSVKTSIKTKRFLAATSDEFRAGLLGLAVEGESDDDES